MKQENSNNSQKKDLPNWCIVALAIAGIVIGWFTSALFGFALSFTALYSAINNRKIRKEANSTSLIILSVISMIITLVLLILTVITGSIK
ncbi:MAG: hypothetical protein LBM60_09110 [Clostridium sp.]|jgi:succinate dehydrogenase/fumarate reductase cytochrome b subunit|nr:hypothetical protein [Clostridium sp.]